MVYKEPPCGEGGFLELFRLFGKKVIDFVSPFLVVAGRRTVASESSPVDVASERDS
jgi:hypothetical protein